MKNIWGNHTLKSVASVKARTSGPIAIPSYTIYKKSHNLSN